MITFAPFRVGHLSRMDVQPWQRARAAAVSPEERKTFEGPWSVTLFVDGEPRICAGAAALWEGRALVWCVLDRRAGRALARAHKLARAWLDALPFGRLEAAVEAEFIPGHRWLQALGFQMETPCAPRYMPDGRDATLYVRLK